MRNAHWGTLEYGEKTENHGKWEIHTLGREIWQGALKKVENFRNVHCRTWNMAIKLKIMEWEKFNWWLEKWRNHWKTWKMRKKQCRTWNMARKLKITEMRITLVRYWNMTRNIEKHEKWEMHTVGPGIWREKKSWKMRNTHFRMWNMARKTEKRWKI